MLVCIYLLADGVEYFLISFILVLKTVFLFFIHSGYPIHNSVWYDVISVRIVCMQLAHILPARSSSFSLTHDFPGDQCYFCIQVTLLIFSLYSYS